jgi:hypothetical protein
VRICVVRHLFLVNPPTKNIRWPRDETAQATVMQGFKDRCKVPGCLGAIDGSLIPMKKPSRQQANQDSDSYYGYKGGIASLLLAVCDINMRFTYVNAGAPACVGDAGLFSRSRLHNLIQVGLMRTVNVPLYFDEGVREDIWPYLVGDAAFPLGEHMMKAIEPPPAAHTAEAEFNTRILLARRVIERAFGRLKGRWVFCKRNVFWNEPVFTRSGIEVCCALHNFLEERAVDIEGEEDNAFVDDLPLPAAGAGQAGTGAGIRDLLVDWVGEH